MSKVEELKLKYPAVSTPSFNKFLEADHTPTKKYLSYMLQTWEDRKVSAYLRTSKTIIEVVKKFDTLLPYIENKDIYSKDYQNFSYLLSVVTKAEEIKEEKTFIREEHANVLMETDDFLFIQPTTHKGSMKYGASTRWCTTSKNDPGTYQRYFRNGLLVYLIDKTETKTANYKKVAFYHEYSNKGLNDSIALFNVNDSQINEGHLISGGWTEETLFELFMKFRYYFGKTKEVKKTKDFVDSFVNTLSQLDFKKFEEHLTKLDETTNVSYIKNTQEKVEAFLKLLNNSKYGNRKTKNQPAGQ